MACVTSSYEAVACVSQEDALELAILEAEDSGDFERAATSAIGQNRCIVLRPGDELFARDYSRDYKQRQIRPHGDRRSYWTSSVGIRDGSCDNYFAVTGENGALSPKGSTKIEISNEPVKPSKPPCVYKSVMTEQDIAACRDIN